MTENERQPRPITVGTVSGEMKKAVYGCLFMSWHGRNSLTVAFLFALPGV